MVLGAARRSLTRETAFLRWANPLVYPFYIFHQTVIVVAAYYLVDLPLGVHLRFLIIGGGGSLAGILAILEVTRRIPGVRGPGGAPTPSAPTGTVRPRCGINLMRDGTRP